MKAVLVLAPFFDVHEGNDDGLGSAFDEVIDHPAVAEIVADRNGEPAPGGFPDLPGGSGCAVVKELDGNGLRLLEDDFATGADHERGIIEVIAVQRIFATGNEIAIVLIAPSADTFGNRTIEGVFGQNEKVSFWMLRDDMVEVAGYGEIRREFELDTRDAKDAGVGWLRLGRGSDRKEGERSGGGDQRGNLAPEREFSDGGGGEENEEAAAIEAEEGSRDERGRKNMGGGKPGESERVKFAAKKFDAAPEDWRQEEGQRTETGAPMGDDQDEDAGEKAENRPEEERGKTEDFPEPIEVRGDDEHADYKASAEAGGGLQFGEADEGEGVNQDQSRKGREDKGEVETGDGGGDKEDAFGQPA